MRELSVSESDESPVLAALDEMAGRVRGAASDSPAKLDRDRLFEIYEQLGISVLPKHSPPVTEETEEGSSGRPLTRLAIRVHNASARWVIDRSHLSPIGLSLFAALFFGASALFIIMNHLLLAALFLAFAGSVESIDAAAARASLASRRDVYVDYMIDRVTDVFLFGALAAAFSGISPVIMWLSLSVLAGSLLSSYGRAQAEALRLASKTRFNRAWRLVGAFLGLSVTAVLHRYGVNTDMALAVGIGLSLIVTIVALIQRMSSALRSTPSTDHTEESWDDDSFLPRLLSVLESGRGFTIVERVPKDRQPVASEVVYIDRYKDQTRVRIFRDVV